MSQARLHPLDGVQRQKIRITDLEVIPLSYRLKRDEQWPDGDQHFIIWQTTTVLVKLHTDAGLVGIGGASRYSGPEQMKAYAERHIKPFLIGKNPFDVEFLAAGKCAHGARDIWAGVDVAMWDLVGQALGEPIYKLLAIDCEPETHLRVYASGGEYSWKPGTRFDGPDSLIEKARHHKANGYTAFKFRPGAGFGMLGITMEQYKPYLYRLREAVGPDFDLIQESNCRWSLEQCLEIAPVLEELGFIWWEEPTRKWDEDSIDKYLQIKAALKTVKVSGGEGSPNRGALADWVDRGAYDIVQQGSDDAGLTEAWYMARMAHERGVICCPHNWQGGLVTIANAHLMAAIPNRLLLESNMTANTLKEGLFKERLAVQDGHLDVPDKPGLGVELHDDLEERFPYLPGRWSVSEEEADRLAAD
ncbi:MAG: mandelate racemase/muconate lactonizing enzyme family protein [Anaerolineae bacterium]|nr:mandelate racemase/muconate lactonizing enzyme family protein [Anaerolineae bacterium]